jgi:hypothetical protein
MLRTLVAARGRSRRGSAAQAKPPAPPSRINSLRRGWGRHSCRDFYHGLLGVLVFTASISWGQNAVTIVPGSNGLSSLQYGGSEFLGNGDFRVNGILLQHNDLPPYYAPSTGTVDMDQKRLVLNLRYNWGTVAVSYAITGARLQMTIVTTNNSSDTIVGVFYEPLGLRFPTAVKEYDGTDPLLADNLNAPGIVGMSYATGTLALVNEDVERPLEIGFPWAWDKPANTFFPLRINTNHDQMYPSFSPTINRPIPPGSSDTYQISLRFGPAGTSAADLAADVSASYAALYAPTVHWTDRRPVGVLVLATSDAGFRTNPRGWFLDPTVDVTTTAGIAAFQARVLRYADTSIAYLKAMNAQGMITWDIEGEQYAQPTSYACDPRQLANLAPEMNGVVDLYFRKFRDAGLRVGVCVRPQDLVIGPGGTAAQQDVSTPSSILIAKIKYAKDRWGATLFYVDSNGGPNDPMDPDVFRKVAAAFPDILLVPEHSSPKYWAYTAPGVGLRDGVAGTPDSARKLYPNAFSMLYTLDGPIASRFADLVQSVARGDVIMFKAWFDDEPANKLLQEIQQQATSPVK